MSNPFSATTRGLESLGRPLKRSGHAIDVARNAKAGRTGALPGSRRKVIKDRDAQGMQVGEDPGIEGAPVAQDRAIDVVIFQEAQESGAMLPTAKIDRNGGNDSDGAAMGGVAEKNSAGRLGDHFAQPCSTEGVKRPGRIVGQERARERRTMHITRNIAGTEEDGL